MLKRFYPDEYVDSIFHIDYDSLYVRGIRNIIFDIDNTLVPYTVKAPTEKITGLFKRLKDRGFGVCLLSNNNKRRVTLFAEKAGLPYVYRASKPWSKGIKKALTFVSGSKANTTLVGDQIFTDVWCGNRQGLYTILVKPVSITDELTVRIKRGLERLVINNYLRQVMKNDG